ncbi:MAG: hypothetical protein MI924_14580 [Chloroflexales bacterium]|nr:hypothetical protein [Chloroflexales bacterium]
MMMTVPWRHCDSSTIITNGRTKSGQQTDHGTACFFDGTLDPNEKERAEKPSLGAKLPHARGSPRGIAPIPGLNRQTGVAIVKKAAHIKPLVSKIRLARERPIIAGDAMWSFVHAKAQAVGIGVALERQTRTIVGLAGGDRAEEACQRV